MHDGDPLVVRYTITGVGPRAPAELVTAVRGALSHPDRVVRNHAVVALGRVGGTAAVEGLIDALRDLEHTVRLLAVQQLERLNDR